MSRSNKAIAMHNSRAHSNDDQRTREAARTRTICIVDPQVEDYRDWDSPAKANNVTLRLVATAEEALRVARTTAVDLWVVNVELPGLSGCELCGMLRGRSSAPVYLVANEYSPAAEQSVLQAKATLFGCKPGHESWLGQWLEKTLRQPAGQQTAVAGRTNA